MNFSRSLYFTALLSILFMSSSFSPSALGAKVKPYQIKAVYIYRIANFVRWEDEDKKNTLQFCVDGNQRVKSTLTNLIRDKEIRGLRLELGNHLDSKCDIVFVSDLAQDTLLKYGPSTLTIGDDPTFTSAGGIILLKTEDAKIKPVINITNAKNKSYVIGSNLMRIAELEGTK